MKKTTTKRTKNDDTLHVCANAHKHYKKNLAAIIAY